jgi:glycosyltransferase involved in cell wall biosynthesis
MRILIVAPMLPDPGGAGAISILLHAQLTGLRERNEVTLVTAAGDEPGEEEAARELTAAGFDVRAADRRQPPTVAKRWRRRLRLATAWLRGTPWRAAWFADPGIQRIVDRLAAAEEFDVAVVEDSAMAGFRLPPGAASVLTEHEVLRPRRVDWHPGRPSQWPGWAWRELDWRRRHRFQRNAWKRFDRVLAFSRRDAEAIAELAPEVAGRVRVSPFGLDLPPVADPAGEDAETLLFAGNFTHQPNRDAAGWLAGEIVPALRRLRPGARLHLVGSSPPPSVLALAGPGVEVTADAPSIEPHLDAAAVVAAPLRTGGGMRMKVLQALAAGKAVVTTPRGTEGFDCFGEPPPLAVADDAEGFAAAVAELLADPGRRHELGRRARAFAESHYAPAAWANRLEAVYEEAREGHKKAGARA